MIYNINLNNYILFRISFFKCRKCLTFNLSCWQKNVCIILVKCLLMQKRYKIYIFLLYKLLFSIIFFIQMCLQVFIIQGVKLKKH